MGALRDRSPSTKGDRTPPVGSDRPADLDPKPARCLSPGSEPLSPGSGPLPLRSERMLFALELGASSTIGRILGVALALVLAASAVAKLADLEGARRSMAELGLPTPNMLAPAVPLAELAVAAALLIVPAWGAVAAFGLLAAFTAFLFTLWRSGSTVPCNCFGALSTSAVSRRDLLRNGLLLTMAAVVAVVA